MFFSDIGLNFYYHRKSLEIQKNVLYLEKCFRHQDLIEVY